MKSTTIKSARVGFKLSLLALALLVGPLALAQDTGWYAGTNVGRSQAKIDTTRITSGLLGSGASAVTLTEDDRSSAYKIFGGYQLNRNLGLEAGYFDLGRFGYTAITVPAGALNGTIKLRGINLDLVGTVPVTERLSVFGRIGANYAQARDQFTGSGAVMVRNPNPSERATNAKVGMGLQYALSDSWTARAEVERYRVNDAVGNKGDIDLASVGLTYRFGAKTPRPAPRVMAPDPVVVAMAPQAVVAPPPPPPPPPPAAPPPPQPPPPRKVSFSADSLFDFDKSVVLPAGQQELDKFASDLRNVSFDVITVTGHTDRIGGNAYNLKLSTRRAEAVKGYMVTSTGIPANRIAAKGVNGADPVTKPGDCVGKKVTKQLIACLQPDRRVDIEVTGTR
ncbi:outer membrane beta-barrel protein [Rhodoferax sp.]|uniref:outer membrane beta-barrel protein n=1 Tax=Rhodoferax sp. TaxID=50421 RepID=UPI00274B3348|nr:OmpA family protein [Rhodoferax sp.]